MEQHYTPMNETNESRKNGRVVDVIKKGNMRMRPRWQFVAQGVLLVVAAALLFLLLLYVVSFIIFILDQDGAWSAAALGPRGWSLFFAALPWGMFLLSFVLLLLLANLLKRYAFIYHQPLFYFLFVFILVTTIAGFVIAATSFHPGISRFVTDNVPVLGSYYEREATLPASVHRGEIVAFMDGGFVLGEASGATSTVVVADGIVFVGNFYVGDTVLVFGSRQADGTIKAFGIQRIATAATTTVPTTTVRAE
ncbi:MAG: hypothetical protein P4L67_00670 [Candidatus Pacebacteria bacterium]|nr:hypothetical protein [Candidatus Paceibacterota bacterium]